MGTGYTRDDVTNGIDDGKVIDASLFDGEFDAIVDAFDSSTGHTHDGTAAEGGPITVTGPAQEYLFDGTAIYPKTDDTYDLGKTGAEFKDLFIDGTANLDTAEIGAGNATLTNLTASGAIDFNGSTVDLSGSTVDLSGSTISDAGTVTTIDINGGSIDGATVGAASASTGAFTTLTASGAAAVDSLTVTNALSAASMDSTPIGNTTAAAGNFTTLDATGSTTLVDVFSTKYVEEEATLSTTTPTVDLDTGNVFSLSTAGNTTFTFSNPPTSGTVQGFTIKVTATGAHTLTWPASVDWPDATAPDAPASGTTSIFVFYTDDGGTTYYGALVGENFG